MKNAQYLLQFHMVVDWISTTPSTFLHRTSRRNS